MQHASTRDGWPVPESSSRGHWTPPTTQQVVVKPSIPRIAVGVALGLFLFTVASLLVSLLFAGMVAGWVATQVQDGVNEQIQQAPEIEPAPGS
jgi:hypothetical protein